MKKNLFNNSLHYKFLIPLIFSAVLLITSTAIISYNSLINKLKIQMVEYGELLSITIAESTEALDSYDQMRYSLESLTLKTSSIYGITLASRKPFIIWASSFHPDGDIDSFTNQMLSAVKLSSDHGVFGHFYYDDGDLVILKPVGELFTDETTNDVKSQNITLHRSKQKYPDGLNPEKIYLLDTNNFNGVLYLRFDWEATKTSAWGYVIQNILIATIGTFLLILLYLSRHNRKQASHLR